MNWHFSTDSLDRTLRLWLVWLHLVIITQALESSETFHTWCLWLGGHPYSASETWLLVHSNSAEFWSYEAVAEWLARRLLNLQSKAQIPLLLRLHGARVHNELQVSFKLSVKKWCYDNLINCTRQRSPLSWRSALTQRHTYITGAVHACMSLDVLVWSGKSINGRLCELKSAFQTTKLSKIFFVVVTCYTIIFHRI